MHDAFPRVGPHVPVYDVTWTEAQQRIGQIVDLDDALDQPNLRLRGGAHEDADEKNLKPTMMTPLVWLDAPLVCSDRDRDVLNAMFKEQDRPWVV